MAQVGQAKLAESNLANYGSDEQRELKRQAAESEEAWQGAGKRPGIQIWRIEKFHVKKWPKERYGYFFGGDSYIILHTKQENDGKLTYDVYFWLGAETSQDEAGTAAYKTVELDDLLGDEPIQYREVQGNETKGFLDLFPKMTVLAGGVDSGFTHVKPTEYKARLLHCRGYKKHVHVYEVPLSADSLNDCDCFVLDAGLTVLQFNGTKSSVWEKRKANAVVEGLKSSRLGRIKDTYQVDGLGDKGNKLIEVFWAHLGGRPASIKAEEETKCDDVEHLKMIRVSNSDGEMKTEEVGSANLKKSALDTKDCFIIDSGSALFVWVGKGANRSEKREAMRYAVEYLASSGRSANIPIARVIEGKEPAAFWQVFVGMKVAGRQTHFKQWKG